MASEEREVKTMQMSLEQIAQKVAPVAQEHNLKAVWVFGSYARDEASPDSDVDLLIDIEGARGTEWMCGGIFDAFEQQFGTGKVDMVTLGALDGPHSYLTETKKRFKNAVLKERKQVYAR
jgi:predicted nucleotidyltransferase